MINITPRGHCYGVVDALVLARNTVLDPTLPRPIYSLGFVVHNTIIAKAFEDAGIIVLEGDRLELLDQIDHGTVIFTAHGVSPEVVGKAKSKGLVMIDTTCPEVAIIHEIVSYKIEHGYDIIYIGIKNHPETDGTLGINEEKIHLVTNVDDINKLNIKNNKIFISNETTLSQWDVEELILAIKDKYPEAQYQKNICSATQDRQSAVAEQAGAAELVLVVGDAKSNNSNKLAQVAIEQVGRVAYRIEDVGDIDPTWFKNINKVAVTAGASTPNYVIREVLEYLAKFSHEDESTWYQKSTCTHDKVLPKGKTKDISIAREEKMRELQENFYSNDAQSV